MANTTSAQKAIRSQGRKAINNLKRRKTFKDERKEVLKMIAAGDAKVGEKLSTFYKAVDKAAKSKAISKNAAARYKSRVVAKMAQPSK